METVNIDGQVVLKSSCYAYDLTPLNKETEEEVVIGSAIADGAKEYLEKINRLFKIQLISSIIIMVAGIAAIVSIFVYDQYSSSASTKVFITGLTLIIISIITYLVFNMVINTYQPTRILTSLSRVNYPLFVQKTKDGLVLLDAIGLQKDRYEFPSYLDNEIFLKSVKQGGDSMNTYTKFLISSSKDQIDLIHNNPHSDKICKNNRVEEFVKDDYQLLINSTGENNIKRYILDIPTISSGSSIITSLDLLIRDMNNYQLKHEIIDGERVIAKLRDRGTLIDVTPKEIKYWLEGLNSWAVEAEGQDIILFNETVKDLLNNSIVSIKRIMDGLSLMIDVTLPSSRNLYHSYNNDQVCENCFYLADVENEAKKINLQAWIKDKILVGVFDDPIFNLKSEDYRGEEATKIIQSILDGQEGLHDNVSEGILDLPLEYVFSLIENNLPIVEVEENIFNGDIKFTCAECGPIEKVLSISKFLKPISIAYATTFWENIKHMESSAVPIIRNIQQVKLSKQQRETALAPIETNLLDAKRSYTSMNTKYSIAKMKYDKIQEMMG